MLIEPPSTLSNERQALWNRLQSDYNIQETGALLLLTELCAIKDRLCEARAVISSEGMFRQNSRKETVEHPALAVERQMLSQLFRCAKLLGISEIDQ